MHTAGFHRSLAGAVVTDFRDANTENEETFILVRGYAASLFQFVRMLTPGPSLAAAALLVALGFTCEKQPGEALDWDDPEFQKHARKLYELGARLSRELQQEQQRGKN